MHNTEILANGFDREIFVKFICEIIGNMINWHDGEIEMEVEGCFIGEVNDITTSMKCGGIIIRVKDGSYDAFDIRSIHKVSITRTGNSISTENVKKVILVMEHGETICFKSKKYNYTDYIQSEKWKEKRKIKLKQVNNKCQLCNASNTELHVHHNNYDNLGHESINDLTVLCKDCHEKFHDIKVK